MDQRREPPELGGRRPARARTHPPTASRRDLTLPAEPLPRIVRPGT
jgi:hypothetical protein